MTGSGRGNIIRFPSPPGAAAALQVRIDLLLVPGPVWRRLLLPGDATFWDLHVAIQDAFGWEDRHLHQFTVDDPRGGTSLRFGIPDDGGIPGADDVLPGWEHRAAAHLRQDAPAALYLYDFAAERQLAVERERPQAAAGVRPRCLAGNGDAPGEDGAVTTGGFDPGAILFSDPRRRWLGKFGHE